MDNEERKFEPQFKPAVQTGLPAAYLKEDAPKIKAAFTQLESMRSDLEAASG